MKELPYFRFTPAEWQNGKISLEDYNLQGFFIQVCGYYWLNDCSITIAMLQKKFKHDLVLLKQCLENEIFYVNNETKYVVINFLNEQFDTLSESRKKRQTAGSKGGINKKLNYSNATAMLQQKRGYKDKDKDKDKDIERENIPAPENEISYFVPIEIMEMYMISDVRWLETISMQNKWTLEQSKTKVKEYVEKLRAENIKEKHKNDVFKYFSNWINTQNNGQKFIKPGKTGIKESEYDGSYAKKRPITSAI